MRIKIEITEGSEEIVIRCRERDERISELERALDNALKGSGEMALFSGGAEFYVPKKEILFFESEGDKIYAQTADKRYATAHKLFELEDMMPAYFVRISKSTIANVKAIASLRREVTGNGELTFKGCQKSAYFSRGYYKKLREKIDEVRFSK
ncbi:MAG: LytTR family transcriptional regulator DNA-binding domain-containing protein [Clostridia bacterium]|nr:LytTR family transcriptional regulator DNA-binding domain-containing protein [Clostridia bacterium]